MEYPHLVQRVCNQKEGVGGIGYLSLKEKELKSGDPVCPVRDDRIVILMPRFSPQQAFRVAVRNVDKWTTQCSLCRACVGTDGTGMTMVEEILPLFD